MELENPTTEPGAGRHNTTAYPNRSVNPNISDIFSYKKDSNQDWRSRQTQINNSSDFLRLDSKSQIVPDGSRPPKNSEYPIQKNPSNKFLTTSNLWVEDSQPNSRILDSLPSNFMELDIESSPIQKPGPKNPPDQ